MPTPRLGGQHAELDGVSAVSATDAWAVGAIYAGGDDSEGVIEHWNGIRWQITLIDRAAVSFFTAVTARGSRFAWAVGGSLSGLLTLAWHGSAWRRVPARCASQGCFLLNVAVASRRLAWAVGTRLNPRTDASLLPVIMRWNGSAWKPVPSPQASGVLDGVAAVSPAQRLRGRRRQRRPHVNQEEQAHHRALERKDLAARSPGQMITTASLDFRHPASPHHDADREL